MAGWTDYLPDWSSKDKLRLCSVYDALSALTAAINERGSVLADYTPLPTVNRLYPAKYYADLIDAKIKEIIPQFVNHTQNNGDFTGFEAIPMWTWETILNSELESTTAYLNGVLDWAWQRYEIINRLQMLRHHNSPDTVEIRRMTSYPYDPEAPGDTFIEALLNTLARYKTEEIYSPVIFEDIIASNYLRVEQPLLPYDPTYWGVANFASTKLEISSLPVNSEYKWSLKIYGKAVTAGGVNPIFDGIGLFTEGFNEIAAYDEGIITTSTIVTDWIGDHTKIPVYPTEVGQISGFFMPISRAICTIDFTGANGFKFKNW